MKNKFFKVLVLTLILIMVMSMAVQAAPTLEKNVAVGGTVTVKVTGVAATDEVTLLVVKAGTSLAKVGTTDIYYIDQDTAKDGKAVFSFSVDTEEFDVYSGYSSMAVDASPLSDIYKTDGGDEGGETPSDPQPTVDTQKSKLYDSTRPYNLTGYRRVFIKLTEENGSWTPTHNSADSAIYYAPEVEGYDGLVKTTSADLTSILNEITWENAEPSAEAKIAKYGDVNGSNRFDGDDYMAISKAALRKITLTLKQCLIADVNDDTRFSGDDYMDIQKMALRKITEFITVTNRK